MHYAVRSETEYVTAKEVFISQSEIELDDDTVGLFDEPTRYKFEEYRLSNYVILKQSKQDSVSLN